MSKHEQKNCPRCGGTFECKVGYITQCQCYDIQLSAEEEDYIATQYSDCLCRNCLLEIRTLDIGRFDNRHSEIDTNGE